jgi:hypothetical protein
MCSLTIIAGYAIPGSWDLDYRGDLGYYILVFWRGHLIHSLHLGHVVMHFSQFIIVLLLFSSDLGNSCIGNDYKK